MTKEQREDLFIQWGLYEPRAQRSMIDEYIILVCKADCSKARFLEFLKDKLEIDGYWEKVGLA